MRKIHISLMVMATLFSSSVFANHMMDSKACSTIVDACKKAGYNRGDNNDKRFWVDCMKPIIMGKSVKDVTVDPATIKQCRTDKIADMKKQMNEFENASK
jgi:hypothetical protein